MLCCMYWATTMRLSDTSSRTDQCYPLRLCKGLACAVTLHECACMPVPACMRIARPPSLPAHLIMGSLGILIWLSIPSSITAGLALHAALTLLIITADGAVAGGGTTTGARTTAAGRGCSAVAVWSAAVLGLELVLGGPSSTDVGVRSTLAMVLALWLLLAGCGTVPTPLSRAAAAAGPVPGAGPELVRASAGAAANGAALVPCVIAVLSMPAAGRPCFADSGASHGLESDVLRMLGLGASCELEGVGLACLEDLWAGITDCRQIQSRCISR